MARLAAIKAAFFRQDHSIIQAERVDDTGAHAARGGRADNDHAVATKQG